MSRVILDFYVVSFFKKRFDIVDTPRAEHHGAINFFCILNGTKARCIHMKR